MEHFLGIDIGGTNIKLGLVSSEGKLVEKRKVPTHSLREGGALGEKLVSLIASTLASYPKVQRVGMGIPGMISKDRKTAVTLANIPEMNHFPLVHSLRKACPKHHFFLDNDANAAALGEYHFGEAQAPSTFLFVTLGTGVGSAAIFNGTIFTGGGNAMEMGHIICSAGTTLEAQIGKAGLVRLAEELLDSGEHPESILYEKQPLNAKKIVKACLKGDSVGMEVFRIGGQFLGEGLTSAIRLLDTPKVYIGGGVGQTFAHIIPPARMVLEQLLPDYYMKELDIKMATLGNDAGIIGAASLCFVN